MTRTSLEKHSCSLARSVDVLGDKWTLMLIRDAFYGVSTFSQFKARLGVAPTVLVERLGLLCEHGVFERVQGRPDVDRFHYKLTDKGRDLFPILIGFMQWGDKWIFGKGQEPIRILDKATRSPVQPIAVQARDGHVVDFREVTFEVGPGMDDAYIQRLRTKSAS
jgi:DNA-binding HxlR family transcriptional regulator